MQSARRDWQQAQPTLDATHLVFLDETWTNTCMTRARGRSARGKRCICSAPHGNWGTTTFIAALRHDAVTASMVLDGAMDRAAFVAYLRRFLCPTQRPGHIIIADNLSSQIVAGVRAAIEAVGATIRYLPAYSPDLSSIEKLFSKLKALLRRAPSIRFGIAPVRCSTGSRRRSAATISSRQDMSSLKSKIL